MQSDKVKLRLLSSFDIEVGTRLEEVKGFVLPTPTMKCGRTKANPFNGAWRNNDCFEKPRRLGGPRARREA